MAPALPLTTVALVIAFLVRFSRIVRASTPGIEGSRMSTSAERRTAGQNMRRVLAQHSRRLARCWTAARRRVSRSDGLSAPTGCPFRRQLRPSAGRAQSPAESTSWRSTRQVHRRHMAGVSARPGTGTAGSRCEAGRSAGHRGRGDCRTGPPARRHGAIDAGRPSNAGARLPVGAPMAFDVQFLDQPAIFMPPARSREHPTGHRVVSAPSPNSAYPVSSDRQGAVAGSLSRLAS